MKAQTRNLVPIPLLALALTLSACISDTDLGAASGIEPESGILRVLDPSLPREGTIYFRAPDLVLGSNYGDIWRADLDGPVTRETYVQNVSYVSACGEAVYVGAPDGPPGEIGADVLLKFRDGALSPVPGLAQALGELDGGENNVVLGPEPSRDCVWAFKRPQRGGDLDVVTWDGVSASLLVSDAEVPWQPWYAGWVGREVAIVALEGRDWQLRLGNGERPLVSLDLPEGPTYAAVVSGPKHVIAVRMVDRTVLVDPGTGSMHVVEGWGGLTYSPDGRFLALKDLEQPTVVGLLDTSKFPPSEVSPWIELPVVIDGGSWIRNEPRALRE